MIFPSTTWLHQRGCKEKANAQLKAGSTGHYGRNTETQGKSAKPRGQQQTVTFATSAGHAYSTSAAGELANFPALCAGKEFRDVVPFA